jgi:hypothetical protein
MPQRSRPGAVSGTARTRAPTRRRRNHRSALWRLIRKPCENASANLFQSSWHRLGYGRHRQRSKKENEDESDRCPMSRAYLVGLFLIAQPGCKENDQPSSRPETDLSVGSGQPTDLASVAPTAIDLSETAAGNPAPGPYEPIDGGPGIDVIELVSPGVCQQKNGLLVECQIGHVALKAPAPAEKAPFMTVLTTHRAGDCSPYPLELKLQADSDPPVLFNPFNSKREITIRRLDRGSIGALIVENSSAWESKAAYHTNCRLWVDTALNKHDPN